jgi:hypothetical protein
MSELKSNRKSGRTAKIRAIVPEEVIRGFELLGLTSTSPSEYRSSQEYAKRFTRCTRTKFTQVTYSGSSH